MASEKKSSVSDVGAWAMNIVSSVGIIMANKQVMSQGGYDFRFATTLTAFHFTVTALVGFISNATGYSTSKHVPLWDLLWFSVVADMSIVGMNLSLMLNSVGFYQISKLSMIPVVCVMEWILHGKNYTREVKAAVFVVVIGVGVCTVTDVKVNLKGFLSAAVAVFCTSLQQIVRAFPLRSQIFSLLCLSLHPKFKQYGIGFLIWIVVWTGLSGVESRGDSMGAAAKPIGKGNKNRYEKLKFQL